MKLIEKTFLDYERLDHVDGAEFRNRVPFPHLNLPKIITDDAFETLCDNLPDFRLFEKDFGKTRSYGQESHNRWSLQYRARLELPAPWRQFISELQGNAYLQFIHELFGLKPNDEIVLTMHWHYTTTGCSVSPHVDASRKLGSHIFYLHKDGEWDPSWGGQTLVLDDGGLLDRHSAPSFDQFREAAASKVVGNNSFIFQRNEHSWHGVRPITCPPGELRKVFIVVVNRVNWQVNWRKLRGKDPDGFPLD